MATTVLWIAIAAVIAVLLVWRLRRANATLETILREERDRTDSDPVSETTPQNAGHGHKPS